MKPTFSLRVNCGENHEDDDLPRAWWRLRSEAFCRDVGGNGKKMTAHVMDKHPDVAENMKRMHEEDPKKWGREMKPKWDAAPQS